jgi:hypothetical protein
MMRTTDPACLQRRVPCSSLASIEAGGAILPSPGDVPGLGFIQALQVAYAGGGGLRRARWVLRPRPAPAASRTLLMHDACAGCSVRRRYPTSSGARSSNPRSSNPRSSGRRAAGRGAAELCDDAGAIGGHSIHRFGCSL